MTKAKVVLNDMGDMVDAVAIKPAKPFAFGVVEGVPVFGLPGKPVSSMVSHSLLAKPALNKMMGRKRHYFPMFLSVRLQKISVDV